jgi:nucleoside-diphosphate-sugar epimerase
MWVNDGQAMTSTTHIANLVHAIDLALTRGRGGEAYFILDDGVRPMKQMIAGIAHNALGLTLPDKSIPSWLADTIGASCEAAWTVLPLKGEPPITRFSAMILSRDSVLKDGKARADLGYAPVVSVEDGLRRLGEMR